MEVKYSVCNHCGNIIEMVKDQGVPVMCCGEAMHELKAGVTDAAVEKHVPVYTVDKQHVLYVFALIIYQVGDRRLLLSR